MVLALVGFCFASSAFPTYTALELEGWSSLISMLLRHLEGEEERAKDGPDRCSLKLTRFKMHDEDGTLAEFQFTGLRYQFLSSVSPSTSSSYNGEMEESLHYLCEDCSHLQGREPHFEIYEITLGSEQDLGARRNLALRQRQPLLPSPFLFPNSSPIGLNNSLQRSRPLHPPLQMVPS